MKINHTLKRTLVFATVLLGMSVLFAETMEEAAARQYVKRFAGANPSTQATERQTILVLTPQSQGLNDYEIKQMVSKVHVSLAETFGPYTNMIAFIDSALEDELLDLFKRTTVADQVLDDERTLESKKVRYALLPILLKEKEKYTLFVSIVDIKTGLSRATALSEPHTSKEMYELPGAVSEVTLSIADYMGIALDSFETTALKTGEASLTKAEKLKLLQKKRENAEMALSVLRSAALRSDDEAFYNTRIAEQEKRLSILDTSIASVESGGESVNESSYLEQPKNEPSGRSKTIATAAPQTDSTTSTTSLSGSEEKQKAPINNGRRGVYLEFGGSEVGPSASLVGLWDLKNWLSVGLDAGAQILWGVAETPPALDIYDGGYWDFDHHEEGVMLYTVDARVEVGIPLSLFYLYAFQGAGVYNVQGKRNSSTGFVYEAGLGADARFFKRHFALGLYAKYAVYFGFGATFQPGLTLGWHF